MYHNLLIIKKYIQLNYFIYLCLDVTAATEYASNSNFSVAGMLAI